MPVSEKPLDETKGQIPDLILQVVLGELGLKSSWMIFPLIPLNGNLSVLNAKSVTTRKAIVFYEDEHYLLKEIPWYCSNEDFVKFMFSFHEKLFKKSFPVPEVVLSNLDMPFVSLRGKYYYLLKFIRGEVYGKKPKQIFNAGQNLARLHTLSSSLEQKPIGKFTENPCKLAKGMVDIVKELRDSNHARIDDDDLKRLDYFLSESNEHIRQYESNLGSICQAKLMQIHGDYNPYNLIYNKDDEVIATLDLENTAFDNILHDLAEGILDFCFNEYSRGTNRFSFLPKEVDIRRARNFIDGYRAVGESLFDQLKKGLADALGATFIELLALGVVRGDFDFCVIDEACQIEQRAVCEIRHLVGR